MKEFVTKLGSTKPAPGGGAAAGISLSMAGACAEKAVRFSEKLLSKEEFEHTLSIFCEIRDIGLKLHEEDQQAFMGWYNARKLPNKTQEEKQKRTLEINKYIKDCITTPFSIYKESIKLMDLLEKFLPKCDKWLISDVGVAVSLCASTLESSFLNIIVNFPFLKDKDYLNDIQTFIDNSMQRFFEKKEKLLKKCTEILRMPKS